MSPIQPSIAGTGSDNLLSGTSYVMRNYQKDSSIGTAFKAKVAGDARGCWGVGFEVRVTSPLNASNRIAANDLSSVEAA